MVVAIVLSCCPLIAVVLLYSCQRLVPLLKSNTHVHLSFSPTRLDRVEIGFVLFLFLYRSLSHSLYTLWRQVTWQQSQPEFVGSEKDHEINLTMPLSPTKNDLVAYIKAVQPESSNSFQWNNLQLALLLSAWTEPAMLLLLATRKCKIRPLGAVNVRNRLELLRPNLCKPEALDLIQNSVLSASYSKTTRRVKRGLELDLIVTLNMPSSEGGSLLVTAFRQVFTILQFAPTGSDFLEIPKSDQFSPEWHQQAKASFTIQHQEPSSWAKVCKDYNPIHTSTIAAKIFGFPGKLAHGNHVVAKACLALGKTVHTQDHVLFSPHFQPSWLEVSFKRPVVLPARLDATCEQTFTPHDHIQDTNFQVDTKDKIRILGRGGFLKREAAD